MQHSNKNPLHALANGAADLFRKLTHSFSVPAVDIPKEGDRLTALAVLKRTPSLSEPDYIKFAVTQHPLYRDPTRYLELQPFLPAVIKFIAAPVPDQNCFSYVLNQPKKIDRFNFADELSRLGYQRIPDNKILFNGDIVCYSQLAMNAHYSHAAVLVKDNIVASRWGEGAPVLEHPIDQLLPEFMDEANGSWESYRKTKRVQRI